jgi:hypothetical protein
VMAKAHPLAAVLVAGSAVYNTVVLAKTGTAAGWATAGLGLGIVWLAWLGAEWLWRRHEHDLALGVVTFAFLLSWGADVVAGSIEREHAAEVAEP